MKQKTNQEAAPRLRGPSSGARLLSTLCLEDEIEADHLIRGIWQVSGELDWSGALSRLRARGSRAGRKALEPRVLATLWLYGLSQGVDSARELARRCRTDLAYRWVLGGESTNHHSLSDFLRQEQGVLEGLLSQTIGALRSSGVASFDTLLVDGTKVDARASSGSFHDEGELQRLLGEQLSRLRSGGLGESGRRRAGEKAGRYAAAAAKLRERQAAARGQGHGRAQGEARAARMRASATDAEARIMRRSDQGYRSSVNVQVGCCAQSGAVLYVGASEQGNDAGLATAAARGMERLCGHRPQRLLADGDYGGAGSAAELRALDVLFLSPPKYELAKTRQRAALRVLREAENWWRGLWAAHGSAARRMRMRVERVIGSMKRRGLRRIPVFGLTGARGWALWHALTHNVLLRLGIRG